MLLNFTEDRLKDLKPLKVQWSEYAMAESCVAEYRFGGYYSLPYAQLSNLLRSLRLTTTTTT